MNLSVSTVPKEVQILSNKNALTNGVKKRGGNDQNSIKSNDGDSLTLSQKSLSQVSNPSGESDREKCMKEIQGIIGESLCQFYNANSAGAALLETTAQNMSNILGSSSYSSDSGQDSLLSTGYASRNYLIEDTAQKIYEALNADAELQTGNKSERLAKNIQLIDECFSKEIGSSNHSAEETYFYNSVYDLVMQKINK